MTEYVSMYPCIECGEDVEARECYDDFGILMHAMSGGQAEPHETGSTADELKRVDIATFARPPHAKTPDFRDLVVRDVSAYFMDQCGLSEADAVAHTNSMLDNALRQFRETS